MESFSTNVLVHAGRAKAWNEIYSNRLSATEFCPQTVDFKAGLTLGGLGHIGLARLVTGPCTIQRTDDHIRSSGPHLYSFLIQLKGRGRFVQGEEEAGLDCGDFTLCDSAVPHFFSLDDEAEMMLVRVPADVIADYLPAPALLCGRRLPAREGLTPTALRMTCSLWKQLEQGLPAVHGESVAHQLMDLIAMSYSLVFGGRQDGSSCDTDLYEQAIRLIEDEIRNPDLSPSMLATELGVSSSDLATAFSRRGDRLHSCISLRRLDHVARRLRSPVWRNSMISEIAYGMGFSSLPLFTRAYTRRYGMSPGEYRRAQPN